MKIVKLLAFGAIVGLMTISGCASESNTAVPREWVFEMEKAWEMRQLGEEALLRPAEPRIADDGTLYIHDFERHLSYIIDGGGKLIGTFAPRGGSEGEVSFYINCFTAGDKVVICAPDKLHFYTNRGQFVKAVPNNLFVRFPLAFKNENEFWVAPGALGDAPEGGAVVTHVDLATGEETVVYEFLRTDAEKIPTGGAVILGLTPQIKMGFDRQAGQIYFGKNSDTVIYSRAIGESMVNSFSFSGVVQSIGEEAKRKHFSQFGIPEEAVASMMAALPDQMAYYNQIQIINGLVYVLGNEPLGQVQTGQNVDIFSPNGRHLYSGRIQVEEGWHIFGSPDNLQLTNGFLYAVQENDAGDMKIVKYSIKLPRS